MCVCVCVCVFHVKYNSWNVLCLEIKYELCERSERR